MTRIAIDVAGASTGGAARYRAELARYVTASGRQDVAVFGTGQRITPQWLVKREVVVRRFEARVAANSFGFLLPGGERTVILRNALHFLTGTEKSALPGLPRDVHVQARLARRSAATSDRIVVPSEGMARRVLLHVPEAEARLIVRYHPFTNPQQTAAPEPPLHNGVRSRYIYVPSLPSIHKDHQGAIERLVDALNLLGSDFQVVLTRDTWPWQMDRRIVLVGPQSLEASTALMRGSSMVYCPTTIESFGYPLAEARSLGVPVLVPSVADTRDVAAAAAVEFDLNDAEALAAAIERAQGCRPAPDPSPFDPHAYFDWLLR